MSNPLTVKVNMTAIDAARRYLIDELFNQLLSTEKVDSSQEIEILKMKERLSEQAKT